MGRPSKYSPELGEVIVKMVRKWSLFEYAAGANGISKDTLYAWMKDDDKLLPNGNCFSDALKAAAGAAKTEAVQKVMEGGRGWQAAAWYLERRDRENWGRFDRIEHSGNLNVNLTNLSEEDLAKVREAAAIVEGSK